MRQAVETIGKSEQGGKFFMDLRVGGIYCLPNGRELIVLGKRQNGRVSYRLSCGSRQYEVSDGGRLICDGKLTAWDISNLYDTGQSVGHEKAQKVQYDY
ncbi:MAG TPA: hypothetical protein VN644_07790 [Pyrinomonadaceae bacterium]|nr:hypothetical protein [Pyrinomonadaceae bacterium]